MKCATVWDEIKKFKRFEGLTWKIPLPKIMAKLKSVTCMEMDLIPIDLNSIQYCMCHGTLLKRNDCWKVCWNAFSPNAFALLVSFSFNFASLALYAGFALSCEIYIYMYIALWDTVRHLHSSRQLVSGIFPVWHHLTHHQRDWNYCVVHSFDWIWKVSVGCARAVDISN